MRSELWWYVARSGGIVAWALVAASVLWGLLLTGERPSERATTRRELSRRATVAKLHDMHRFLSGLALVFVVVHGVGLLLDDTLGLSVVDIFVPWAADADPSGLAWGIVAFYLLLAVETTSLLRTRVPEAIWRGAHVMGLVVFLLGTVHGLDVGTDVENPLIWWPAAAASAAIVGLAAYRLLSGDLLSALSTPSTPPRAPQPATVTAALLERTLTELERLDTDAYPSAARTATAAGPPTVAAAPPAPTVAPPTAAPTAPPSAAPTPAPQPSARDAEPGLPRVAPDAHPHEGRDVPRQPPVPSRAPADTSRTTLPTRVPRRLAATTAPAAALGAWAPASSSTPKAGGPPPPPENAVDPETGEPDPQAYRKWLRDWLEYVESQP